MQQLLPLGPGMNPVPCNANSAPGFARRARTNLGTEVNVWVPVPNALPDRQYFCHGHSLGTHTNFGYTVFSGADLQAVLRDEWYLVGNVHHAQPGDIVVWRNVNGNHGLVADHSARIESPITAISSDGIDVRLSSKNGTNPLQPSVSLTDLVKIYGTTFELCRHR